MNRKAFNVMVPTCLLIVASISLLVWAHCDTLSGPVVTDAKKALQSGKPDAVLKWVSEKDEKEIRDFFDKTLSVRKQSQAAADLADRYFFETIVRLHRAGEGAPYTGLKESADVEPIVQKSDHAIASGKGDALIAEIRQAMEQGIRNRFDELKEKEKHKDHNIEAGREYVRAYVEFVHYVESLHNIAARTASFEKHQPGQEHAH